MKQYKTIILLLLLGLVFSFASIETRAASGMNYIHYMISGGGTGLNDLKLNTNYQFDHINRANLLLYYDIDNFNVEASWELNFWQNNTEELSLLLALATNRPNIQQGNHLGKAIGLTGEGNFTGENNYFFDLKYYFSDSKIVSQAGLTIPIIYDSQLSLGIGNSYWDDRHLFNLGVKFNF